MGIRYMEAVRLIDELERRGVIGPKRPGWPTREILVETEKAFHGRVTCPV